MLLCPMCHFIEQHFCIRMEFWMSGGNAGMRAWHAIADVCLTCNCYSQIRSTLCLPSKSVLLRWQNLSPVLVPLLPKNEVLNSHAIYTAVIHVSLFHKIRFFWERSAAISSHLQLNRWIARQQKTWLSAKTAQLVSSIDRHWCTHIDWNAENLSWT